MSRPLKEFRTKSIGGSLALYNYGTYVGSISYRELYQLMKGEAYNGKGVVLAKNGQLQKSAAEVGSGKETNSVTNGPPQRG